MSTTCTFPERGIARANKIYVVTKHSQDGRSLEGFWMDYNPDEPYALFLLEFALGHSAGVDYYSVYDEHGNRISDFVEELSPKRQ